MVSSDLSSMIKVREEALSYKYKKEKNKIQSLLSSQKISPRTGDNQEVELEKWVCKEMEDIDKTKEVYAENKKKTEEILHDTVGLDNVFSNFNITHENMKKLFKDKVITPREGKSQRSAFSDSRRLYELSQINKQINEEDNENVEDLKDFDSDFHELSRSDIHQKSSIEENKNNLQKKIENKLKEKQEITFGKEDQEDNFFKLESISSNGEIFEIIFRP